MNITYLIGNGFDVHLGLKTRYTDFYDIYIEKNENSDDPIIRKFCKDLIAEKNSGTFFVNWSDFEAALPKYVKTREEVKKILSSFTRDFSEYLERCDESYKIIPSDLTTKFVDFLLRGYQKCLDLNDKQLLDDFLGQMGAEVNNSFINFINFNYTNTISNFINAIALLPSEKTIHIFPNTRKLIINNEIHIHGSLKDRFVIIGIDSKNQLKYDSVKNDPIVESYCVKKAMNARVGYNSVEEAYKQNIKKSDIIFTYGVSFGESDLSRIQIIKEWLLDKNKKHILVVYQYQTDFSKFYSQYRLDFLDYYESKKEDLLEKLGINFENITDELLNRIVIIDSDEVLNFKLVDEESAGNPSQKKLKKVLFNS